MATIYLNCKLQLGEEEEDKALELAKNQLRLMFDQVSALIPSLEEEILQRKPDWSVESGDFDPDLVSCDAWDEGEWSAGYMFEVVCTSPDGIPECDCQMDEYDVWRELGQPTYKDICEPLYYCDWSKFKREGVDVEFDAVKAVDKYSGHGLHFYSNHYWL
jgi:hypothetical protein